MGEDQIILDIENIQVEISKLEYWVKNEFLNFEDLKEIYRSLERDYFSSNQDMIFADSQIVRENFDTINRNNKKMLMALNEEVMIHNNIKSTLDSHFFKEG